MFFNTRFLRLNIFYSDFTFKNKHSVLRITGQYSFDRLCNVKLNLKKEDHNDWIIIQIMRQRRLKFVVAMPLK